MSMGEALRTITRRVVGAGRQEEQAIAQASRRAWDRAVDAVHHAYDITREGVSRTAGAVADVAQRGWAVAKGGAATAVGVAGGATAVSLGATGVAAAGLYNTAHQRFSDKQPALKPLTVCSKVQGESAEDRQERLLRRQALIAHGKRHPMTRESAERLERDMKSVELARLSAHVYTHYDPNGKNPSPLPQPWKVASDGELEKMGLKPAVVRDAKAAVYTLPPGFPFEPKTVVAFRGTVVGDAEDLLVNHDNALGMETRQYGAAMAIGKSLRKLPFETAVTGHSLGGGKAQAAVVGAGGRVSGEMFNSAGVHPDVLKRSPSELAAFDKHCIQHRTVGGLSVGGGDPLTGLQMSMAAQRLTFGAASAAGGVVRAARDGLEALGKEFDSPRAAHEESQVAGAIGKRLSTITPEAAADNFQRYGWYVPPTLGQSQTRTVVSKNTDGTDSGLAAQHSIVNMVNGYESRKIQDVQRLVTASGTQVPVERFIGPS
jgi:hypothetical protein